MFVDMSEEPIMKSNKILQCVVFYYIFSDVLFLYLIVLLQSIGNTNMFCSNMKLVNVFRVSWNV